MFNVLCILMYVLLLGTVKSEVTEDQTKKNKNLNDRVSGETLPGSNL